MEVCTIIAKNYVAHARVLARSLRAQDPEARLSTLIIDDFSRYIDPAGEPFDVLTPADVGCEPFVDMALRYTVLELSTAVKPWLLRHLMQQTGGPVTYLDPDIKVYASLRHLDELAAAHGVVLIPHNSAPIPPDGRKPGQVDVMIAGVYNLGYISLAPGPEVERLLDWWGDRLRRDCRVDPVWGYFVDQRWFDLAPGFLTDLAIVRDPEYNVAYWNLHSRRLEDRGGRYVVDGRPLAFFHFSGFDPEHPLALSRHQDRIDVSQEPVLERLLGEYAAEVMAEGHAVSRKWPYSYTALGDGTRIDELVRSLYDEFAEEEEQAGGHPPSPFTLEGARLFKDWLRLQAPAAPPGINRLLAHIYGERRDLQTAFPELAGPDRQRLLVWAAERGQAEIPLLGKVGADTNGAGGVVASSRSRRRSRPGEEDASARLRRGPWGVNVVGRFESGGELAEAARQLIGALDAAGIPSLPVSDATVPLPTRSYGSVAPEQAVFPVNLLGIPPDALGEFARQAGEEFFGGRYSVALSFCDAPTPDRWHDLVSGAEEVWAPSEYSAGLLGQLATVPVNVIPIPVAPGPFRIRSRTELGLPHERFLFLARFDATSEFERQNPLAAIEAFVRASLPAGRAQLIVECLHGERDPRCEQLRDAAAGNPDIQLLDASSGSHEASLALMSACDCYLSLHRAEAFGIAMAQAMWLGKPVIATGYSGNREFMSVQNSLLVEHSVASPPVGGHGLGGGHWVDPDVEHAATLLRQTFEDPAAAQALGARAAAEIRRTRSPAACAEVIGRRLELIRATGVARDVVRRVPERPPAVAQAQARIAQGPPPVPRGGRGRRVRGFVRKLILRMLRPYTDYQEKVNSELAAGLSDLGGSIGQGLADARAEVAVERAQLMMELRRSAQPEAAAEGTSTEQAVPTNTDH